MDQAKTFSGGGEGGQALALASQSTVLVQVYLWTENEEGVPPPALAMVADLLQVRGGKLRESGASSIAATFADPVLAVNAARNLQRLVEGFSRAWQDGALGGCTTLTRADEASGIDVGSLRENQTLKQTHPGQVIFVGGLCDGARSIPGLEFRAIAGVARQALQLLPPVRMEGYVEEPFEAKVLAPAVRTVAPEPLVQVAEPVAAPAYVLVSTPASGRTAMAASGSVPAAAPMMAMDEIGAFSREEKSSGGGFSRWAIVGGLGAVALACVLVFTPILKRTPHAAPAQAEPAAIPEPAIPAESVAPAAALPAASAKSKASDTAHSKGVPHATAAPVEQPDAAPAPVEETHVAHGLTFTAAEISSLIAHADKDSGDGNFDKAIQEYRLVLNREPANDLAKRGLARALYNKEHR
jgi:hypothetical protein